MNSVTLHPSRLLGFSLLFMLPACAPASDGGEGPDGSGDMEVRIEMGSADDAGLPAAILGTAPAPRGEDVRYRREETRPHAGTWRCPKGKAPFRRWF